MTKRRPTNRAAGLAGARLSRSGGFAANTDVVKGEASWPGRDLAAERCESDETFVDGAGIDRLLLLSHSGRGRVSSSSCSSHWSPASC